MRSSEVDSSGSKDIERAAKMQKKGKKDEDNIQLSKLININNSV